MIRKRFSEHSYTLVVVDGLQYLDGFSYSKYKMEEAFRPGGFLEKPPLKAIHLKDPSAPVPKREDIDLIVSTLYCLPTTPSRLAPFFKSLGMESKATLLISYPLL
jgi:hypothetical protein